MVKINAAARLRDLRPFRTAASSIKHVALAPEVQHALIHWIKSKVGEHAPGVLIGGLALSFYAKPRYTQDIDLLFLNQEAIPKDVAGFKRHRRAAFEEQRTGVEVETVTSASLNIPQEVAVKVTETAIVHDGLRVASKEGLIVLKLYAAQVEKRYLKDMADIVLILEHSPTPDLHTWGLSPKLLSDFEEAKRRALLK